MASHSSPAEAGASGTGEAPVRFRPVEPGDRTRLLEIAAGIWEGNDYLPYVFDGWVAEHGHDFVAMLLDEQVVGCGRLVPFDRRRGWLEGLRVDRALQGRGLGRRLARHLALMGRERGFERLHFSTYFGNHSSIRINEEFGFRRTATCTNLELEIARADWAAEYDALRAAVEVRPGVPETSAVLANDWTFLPGDLPGRERYFPAAEIVRRGDCRILVAENIKYRDRVLDIAWIDAPDGRADPACLRYAAARARATGRRVLHSMVPPLLALTPFLEVGFAYFEQPCDVYLFEGDSARLQL